MSKFTESTALHTWKAQHNVQHYHWQREKVDIISHCLHRCSDNVWLLIKSDYWVIWYEGCCETEVHIQYTPIQTVGQNHIFNYISTLYQPHINTFHTYTRWYSSHTTHGTTRVSASGSLHAPNLHWHLATTNCKYLKGLQYHLGDKAAPTD